MRRFNGICSVKTNRHMSSRLPVLVAVVLTALMPSSAEAATPEQIFADWREPDGVIDGDYTLAELRQADAMINPQEREYTFWDAAYADALQRLQGSAGRRPRAVGARRAGEGKLMIGAIAAVAHRALAPRAADSTPAEPAKQHRRRDATAPSARTEDDGDDGGAGRMLGLLAIAPALVFGVGTLRHRRKRTRESGDL
jgi:hypothetical protein